MSGPRMTLPEFEKLTAKAIRGLPEFFRSKMENVVVAETPARGQARRFGNLLGLYEGIPLLDRTSHYSGAMPDKITIFKNNIEARCSGADELEAEVRHVVMHEIAHHFGIDDDELRQKGLY
jgi:predicted Zn-dependent protease with MMP-like domain